MIARLSAGFFLSFSLESSGPAWASPLAPAQFSALRKCANWHDECFLETCFLAWREQLSFLPLTRFPFLHAFAQLGPSGPLGWVFCGVLRYLAYRISLGFCPVPFCTSSVEFSVIFLLASSSSFSWFWFCCESSRCLLRRWRALLGLSGWLCAFCLF